VRTLAVVGAGFCGTMVATHVLRASRPPFDRLVLVERNGREIGGVAYGTPSTSHTLNVPAGRMSAFEDDPDDFLRFVRAGDPALTGGAFVPRRLYGEYLAQTLATARARASVPLIRVAGEVTGLAEQEAGAILELRDGRRLEAAQVVLAVGNYPPSDPPIADDGLYRSIRYARDPWAPDALEGARDEPVLLVGTGLTMCDVALALRDADQDAPIVAISRRGLLPQPHRVSPRPPPHLDPPAGMDAWPSTALGLLRGLRGEVERAARDGVDWREVVTSIRHDTPALWGRLDEDERRRFLRHLRPYWETHRHRSSPETAFAVEAMVESGALRLVAGHVLGATETDGGVAVRYATRTGEGTLEVGKVINCTGPNTDLVEVRDPLVASLRETGLIRPDALGLGLDTDDDGRLLDAAGRPSARVSLAGPLRKGRLWEHTAVPELRVEALRLARRLCA
jgi:uncharacterized NAD(P)/FAD-binding protein YdhS